MAPKRPGKKGTLHYALELCDQMKLTTIISSTSDGSEKEIIEVMHFIRKRRNALNGNISPLQAAVSLGYYNLCKQLIDEGAILKSVSNLPHPLCIALQKGHYNIVRLLIDSGADINLAFEEIYPLGYALDVRSCTAEIVQTMIDAGFPKNGIVHESVCRTALHSAVRMNNVEVVKYLLKISVDLNARDNKGLTPLHYAVQRNYLTMVKILVKAGAIIDCECLEHFTPMLYAIAAGNYDMIKVLLSLGADIHYLNKSKCSVMPLHFAANVCRFKIVQLLLENGAEINRQIPLTGETPLHCAARADTQNVVQNKIALDCVVEFLIKKGADVTARHKFGLTPLQVAIKAKNMNVAKVLIINGSSLNIGINEADDRKYTTFHIISKCLDKDLTKLCFDYGADCYKTDDEGLYPIHLALLTSMVQVVTPSTNCKKSLNFSCNESDQVAIFKMFWKQGFPFDLTLKIRWLDSGNPQYPTKIAALVKKQKMLFNGVNALKYRVVKKAISQGAEVNSCSTEIRYPLHFIASKGNVMIMKLFLAGGVTVNSLDKDGQYPLHIAAKYGHLQCCQLLLEFGASYNYKSERCPKTPLELAKENKHQEVAVLLSNVNKYFKALKSSNLPELKPSMNIFLAVMNCCNRDGNTLLGRALQLNMKDLAKQLMMLRSKIPSSYET